MPAKFGVDEATVLGLIVSVQSQPHQAGDAVLGVEHGTAAGLGRVRGDDRRYQRVAQRDGHRLGVETRSVELDVGRRERAVDRRFTRGDVHSAAALAVDVLGNIGQQRKMTEGSDHRDGAANVDTREDLRHLGTVDFGAPDPEGLHPGSLDEVEDLLATLLPHRVTQNGTEHPDVGPHRFGVFPANLGAMHGTDRFQGRV